MTNPEDIAERFWSLAQKPAEEARREQVFLDDVIHKAHLEREIEGRLAGVKTVLDVGAGTGRFSLRLAARGLEVTHVDISPGMLEQARRDAAAAGLTGKLTFRQGRLADLVDYAPQQFDLVICSDAPISYAYPDHAAAISSLVQGDRAECLQPPGIRIPVAESHAEGAVFRGSKQRRSSRPVLPRDGSRPVS